MKVSKVRPVITNINDLSTSQIMWHLVKRHMVVLLVTTNVVTLTAWLVTQAPASITAITK